MKCCLLIFNLVWLLSSCSSKTTGKGNVGSNCCEQVSLGDLLKYEGAYHGKFVQTEGYFFYGVDHQSIQLVPVINRDSLEPKQGWSQSIWITTAGSETSLLSTKYNNRIVIVQGLFDTSKHGFLGEFAATLNNAVLLLK